MEGIACDVKSTAEEGSPQNCMMTFWDAVEGLIVLKAPTRIQIIPNTMSSSMPGGRTPELLGRYFLAYLPTF